MQFESREVIDARPARVFETIGSGFDDVSTWAGGGSSERAVRRSLAAAVKTTATPAPHLEEGVQASAHPTAPHAGTSE